jgi:hypothetical protein
MRALDRRLVIGLVVLGAVRVAIPLAALAASGTKLPGLPRYDYAPTTGDGSGFYAAAREFMGTWSRLPAATLACVALFVVAATGAILWARRTRGIGRAWTIVAAAAVFALAITPAVAAMHPPGAGVVGWPIVWSLPMLPYRVLGLPLDRDIAFAFGLTISLVANLVTLTATAFAGIYATGRRSVALLAASLFAIWPLLTGLVAGARGWENGAWTVDAGLVMYDEPVSTALAAVALALLLSPSLAPERVALAGVALGLATTVKLTNGIAAALALVLLLWRLGPRRTLPYTVALLAFVPVVVAYWPKGYAAGDLVPPRAFSLRYVVRSWSDSVLFGPRMLLVLVPLALVGAVALRAWWPRLVLAAFVLGNVVVYSVYVVTPQHPRFFFASLPAVFVLWSLGVVTLVGRVGLTQRRESQVDAEYAV